MCIRDRGLSEPKDDVIIQPAVITHISSRPETSKRESMGASTSQIGNQRETSLIPQNSQPNEHKTTREVAGRPNEDLAMGVECNVPVSIGPPKNGIEFERSWRSFKGNEQMQAKFFDLIDPGNVKKLLKQTLAPKLLFDIMLCLLGPLMEANRHHAVALLKELPSVERFDMNLMSLSKSQKATLKQKWESMPQEIMDAIEMDTDKYKF